MSGDMFGADADVLTATARQFGRSSERLRVHRAELGVLYAGAGWTGEDAERSRGDWRSIGAPSLLQTSEFLASLEAQLLQHAAEQRRASAVDAPMHPLLVALDELLDDVRDGIETVGDGIRDGVGSVIDDLFGDGEVATVSTVDQADGVPITGLRPGVFDTPGDARGAVLDAMQGLAEEERIGSDEIEIRALDNGRYIVVLPGVTDLSAGVDEFVGRVRDDPFGIGDAGRDAYEAWADNDEPTVRKMRYAFEAAVRDDTTVNEYSVVTTGALEAAGVPAGAEVMIIGHSFGAYTAMDLAAEPAFNAAHGVRSSGYQVSVTHVVAAGAETDWRFAEIPAGTSTLVVNNRFDLVYRAEDVLHGDGDAEHPGHVEQNFWGDWQGKGHDEHNYIEWLAETGNDDIAEWFDGMGDRYTSGGTRVSAQVPDPNL